MENEKYQNTAQIIFDFIINRICIFSIEVRRNILKDLIFSLRSQLIKYDDYLRSVSFGKIPENIS